MAEKAALLPLPLPLLRIAIVGAESTGKSTLAQALAAHLGPAAQTTLEYARSRWTALGPSGFGYADMLPIAQMQVRLEDEAVSGAAAGMAALPPVRWLLCDTTPLTTLYYSLASFGKAPLALWALSARSYDAVLLCAPDFAFVQDGQRSSDAFRQRQHSWHVQALAERDTHATVLHGPLPERLALATAAIGAICLETGVAQSVF